jgi:small subunit ribosomal protein S6
MRRYEQVFILRPSLSEEEITRIIENSGQLIEQDGGTIIFLNKWGMRKLAYPIKKEVQGYYVLCDFAASPDVVSEIERKYRIDDAVLKYMTVKVADAISADEVEAARSEAEAKAITPEAEESAAPEAGKTADAPAADSEEKKPETPVQAASDDDSSKEPAGGDDEKAAEESAQ